MKNILSLNNISKSFENRSVLKDITLDIQKGKIISLLGKSGSGKTTLLNIIAGFETSDSGMMSVNNKIVFDRNIFLEAQKRNIGFVFQNYALFPHMNIFENITFGIEKLSKEEKVKIVNGLLKLVDMEGYETQYPHQISGGQQQRIALLRALAPNPELILLDEPFSSIDTMMKASIQKELLHILKASHKTAIIVTHDPNEAMAMSDKIVYLENGEIVQYDTPKNIYNYPNTQSIATSFGMASFLKKEDIVYCVRSEHCQINDSGKTNGIIKNQIFKGSHYQIELEVDGAQLIINSSNFIDNEQVQLEIDWEKCHKI